MVAEFVVEEPPVPKVVYVQAKGKQTATRHLTDDHKKTLCGRTGTLVLAAKNEEGTCQRCVQAVDGWARFYRLIR